MKSQTCRRITGAARKRPAKKATFMYMKNGAVRRVYASLSPGGRNFVSGSCSFAKICSDQCQQRRKPTKIAIEETISRLRSSSR